MLNSRYHQRKSMKQAWTARHHLNPPFRPPAISYPSRLTNCTFEATRLPCSSPETGRLGVVYPTTSSSALRSHPSPLLGSPHETRELRQSIHISSPPCRQGRLPVTSSWATFHMVRLPTSADSCKHPFSLMPNNPCRPFRGANHRHFQRRRQSREVPPSLRL